MWPPRTVLAIGAHTDDIELGCGATLSRLRREGARIVTAAFSRAEISRPPGTPPDILEREYREAMSRLGLASSDVRCYHFPVRSMSSHRQEILDTLISLRGEVEPDLIITMCGEDTHQDHQVIHAESVRAFRNRQLLAYQSPWNQRVLRSNMFVPVSRSDLVTKTSMLAAYQTQVDLDRVYVRPAAIEAAVRFYGLQCGHEYAEAFEALSIVMGSPREID